MPRGIESARRIEIKACTARLKPRPFQTRASLYGAAKKPHPFKTGASRAS